MSASTSSYSSLLGSMWGPEGSDINQRLKRLQELEQMRKEREALRQAKLNNAGTGVSAVRSSRLKSSDLDSDSSTRFGIRRTLSLREDDESSNYGGARPKFGGVTSYGQEEREQDGNIFSGAINEMLSSIGVRKPLRGTREQGSGYDFMRSNITDKPYSRSYSKPEDDFKRNVFGDLKLPSYSKPSYESRTYTSRFAGDQNYSQNRENGYNDNSDEEQTNNVFENGDNEERHEEENEEDHGEEPKYFIERLKYGKSASQADTNNYNSKHVQSIPAVPPFKSRHATSTSKEDQNQNMPELVTPTDDILSVANEISTTFGNFRSPTGLTPSSKNRINKEVTSSEIMNDPNVSVTYEIIEVDDDSSEDERGKTLSVNDNFYTANPSEWDALNQTQGKLDEMHEFFTGEPVGDDPNISRELDGDKVRAELEKSVSEVKTPKSDKKSGRKTPTSLKKSTKKESKDKRSKSPLDKLKGSESENDSSHTLENEVESQKIRQATPRRAISSSSAKKEDKNGMSLSDKLAKLETLTQEKKRKHSISENETKKPVPSYMTETSSSQKKRSRSKDTSPHPTRDLKKDVRELKQFVHQHTSEPNTPATSPTKLFNESIFTEKERKATREISVQTEFVIDFPDINYVCKHCGKSSFEEVSSPLTRENLTKTFEKKTKRESPESEKAKNSETKFSSKDSVKSLGELSTKSEKSYRCKPKTGSGTQGYMKGTTSSRLKNSASNLSSTDGKVRKGSAPDIVHITEAENAKGSTSLKGIVSQKTKAIESANKKEKNKPTLSVFRGNSVDRDKSESSHRGQLGKSKSSDHVNVIKNEMKETFDREKQITETRRSQKESSEANHVPPSAGEKRTLNQMNQKAPSPVRAEPQVEKLDLTSLELSILQVSPKSPVSLKKPPPVSPRVKDSQISPRSDTLGGIDNDNIVFKSKGHFTTIDDNPFIKNDLKRKNSLRGRDKSESVWEKAENRSRDSSLKRSNSTSEADGERRRSTSSLKRHNTSAGEKSSVSELTWSDSGSTGSLRGSKSSLHGSDNSLNRDETRSAFGRPRSVSNSSGTSQTSQNAMLNLLSPIGTKRNPVSGAMETDIDVAYSDHVKEQEKTVTVIADEHNEESVNRAHLEFAKKACDLLEFELKKRDSSNESDRGDMKTDDNKENNNNHKNMNGEDSKNSHSLVNGTESGRKEKGKEKTKKGFLKGKLFKK